MNETRKVVVSIVVPNHNGARFLKEALDSVLAQTYQNFELIVVDDNSTDASWRILEQYAAQDARVRILRNKENKGVSYTRNRGLEVATGEYVAFVDSDDVMGRERLTKQVVYLREHPDVVAVGSWLEYINEEGSAYGTKKYQSRWCGKDSRVLCMPLVAQTATMARRTVFEHVGLYGEQLRGAEDYDLWLRVLSNGLCIGNLQEALTSYRIHDGQGTMAHAKNQKNGFRVRLKYLFSGFFSLRGLMTTLGIGILVLVPRPVRNIVRVRAIRTTSQ